MAGGRGEGGGGEVGGGGESERATGDRRTDIIMWRRVLFLALVPLCRDVFQCRPTSCRATDFAAC
jgi:hypothetical protein